MRLRPSHIVALIALAILTTGMIGLWSMIYNSSKEVILQREWIDLEDEALLRAQKIQLIVMELREDVRELAAKLEHQPGQMSQAELETRLKTFLKEKKQQDKQRLYTWAGMIQNDRDGRPLLKAIQRTEDGLLPVKNVPFQKGQAIQETYHQAIQKGRGILLSRIDPMQMELRAAARIAPDKARENPPVACIGLDFKPLAQEATRSTRAISFLAENEGAILAYPKDLFPTFEVQGTRLLDVAAFKKHQSTLTKLLGDAEDDSFELKQVLWPQEVYMLPVLVNEGFANSPEALKALNGIFARWQSGSAFKTAKIPTSVSATTSRFVLRGSRQELSDMQKELELTPELAPHLELKDVVGGRHYRFRLLRAYLDPDDPERFVALAMGVSQEEILSGYSSIWAYAIMGGLFAVGGTLITGLFISWMRTAWIRKLTQAAEKISKGNFDVKIPRDRRERSSVVEKALNVMVTEVQQKTGELMESEARHRAILSTAAEGIITFETDGSIESFNHAAERILGYKADEVIGKNGRIFFAHPTEDDETNPVIDLDEGSFFSSAREVEGRRKDGSTFPMEVAVSHVPLMDRTVITAIVRDITERKKIEEERVQMNEMLEERVRERTAELEQQSQELAAAKEATEQAMKAQEIFLNNMAHDLRTPLAVVIGYSEDLLRQAEKQGQEAFIPDLSLIVNRGNDLRELIDDLLTVSKAMNDKDLELTLKEFDVAKMLQKRVEGLGYLAKRYRNKLELRCPDDIGTMVADEVRTWRVLMNLLTNACKFTRKGVVSLTVERREENGTQWLIFQIKDTGTGIEPDKLERLFNRFEQVHKPGSHLGAGGVGLGLSICALYCRAMGGDISVESTVGKGSTFTVCLPANMSKMDKAPTSTPLSRQKAQFRSQSSTTETDLVLIIDDDISISELVKRNLSEEGVEARTATTGEEGLRLAKELLPSAIVLDVVLPGIDGWAVLAALKTDPRTADIPIIMATMLDEKQRGLSLGADEYLTKPFTRDRIIDLIHKHVHPGRRVLIVEDDLDTRDRIARMMREQHWEVVEAENGKEALHKIAEDPPSLMLLDLLLPVMDGFQVIEHLRQNPEWQKIPVIVITHVDLDNEKRQFLQGQVQNILSKELFSRDELLQEVKSLVQQLAHQQNMEETADVP